MEKKKINISVRVSATKAEPEKITNLVGTFLTNNRHNFQVPPAKAEPEKVYATVPTFLNEDSNGFPALTDTMELEKVDGNLFDRQQLWSSVSAIQTTSEKVACVVGTFLSEDMDGMRIISA
jgi:hypothetical protein